MFKIHNLTSETLSLIYLLMLLSNSTTPFLNSAKEEFKTISENELEILASEIVLENSILSFDSVNLKYSAELSLS